MNVQLYRIIKTVIYTLAMNFPSTLLVSFFFFGSFDSDTVFAIVNVVLSMLTFYIFDITSNFYNKTHASEIEKFVVPSIVIVWFLLLLGLFIYAIILDTKVKTVKLTVARDKDVTITETSPDDRSSDDRSSDNRSSDNRSSDDHSIKSA